MLHISVQPNLTRSISGFLLGLAGVVSGSAYAQWNPAPNWEDSYSVNGVCYCNSSNYDHGLSAKTAPTPIGELNVVDICTDIKAVLGEGATNGRIPFNDIQCGNGPANDAADEAGCPGRVDIGSAGCDVIGPKWDLVSVYGPWPDGGLNRDAWEVSASNGSGSAQLALDGLASTRWATGVFQSPGQYFDIDFQDALTFDSIVLATTENPEDYPRAYEVYISSNGSDWGVPVVTGAGNGSTTTIELDTVTTRYLRILQTGSSSNRWWSIHEFNIFNSGPIPPEPEYPALDRSDWTVSASVNGAEAEFAIDSSPNTRWDTAQSQRAGQSFEVDLGELNTLAAIELDSAGSANDYPRGYAVYVSNDGSNWGSAIASGAAVSASTTIEFTPVSARFVKIEQTGGDGHYWWSIHNLNIFGEPSDNPQPTIELLDSTPWSLAANRRNSAAGNAIDNNQSTRWTTGQTQRDGQTFEIDLSTVQTFSRIVLDSAASDDDHPRNYELYVSNDGSNWGRDRKSVV